MATKDRNPDGTHDTRYHLTGFGDTETEARDDLLRKGRELAGGPVELSGYDGHAPALWFNPVHNTIYAYVTSKKLYVSSYIKATPAGSLEDAARAVVDSWESGGLASAVRRLAELLPD
jgi:hypothetical protein